MENKMIQEQKLRQIIKEEIKKVKLREASLMDAKMAIQDDLEKFVEDTIKKSKGYVKNKKDSALLIIQILKDIYKI